MTDINIGSNGLLTQELTADDRVTITRAATGQQVATMTVGDFMRKCAEMMPAVTLGDSSKGLMTGTQLRAGYYKEFYVGPGETVEIGRVQGSAEISCPSITSRVGIYLVNAKGKTFEYMFGQQITPYLTFSFTEAGNLQVTSAFTYHALVCLVYREIW